MVSSMRNNIGQYCPDHLACEFGNFHDLPFPSI